MKKVVIFFACVLFIFTSLASVVVADDNLSFAEVEKAIAKLKQADISELFADEILNKTVTALIKRYQAAKKDGDDISYVLNHYIGFDVLYYSSGSKVDDYGQTFSDKQIRYFNNFLKYWSAEFLRTYFKDSDKLLSFYTARKDTLVNEIILQAKTQEVDLAEFKKYLIGARNGIKAFDESAEVYEACRKMGPEISSDLSENPYASAFAYRRFQEGERYSPGGGRNLVRAYIFFTGFTMGINIGLPGLQIVFSSQYLAQHNAGLYTFFEAAVLFFQLMSKFVIRAIRNTRNKQK